MPENACMCLQKHNSEYALGPKYTKCLIWQSSEYGRVLHNANVTQRSEAIGISLGRVLNISWVLDMSGF